MEDVFMGVDPELELIYIGILRKLLETPENWSFVSYSTDRFISPPINDGSKLQFRTCSNTTTDYLSKVRIVESYNGVDVHSLTIGVFDFKTRRLLKRLSRFMEHRDDWEKSQKANRILKEGLGSSFDRLQKLLKLKKKISEE